MKIIILCLIALAHSSSLDASCEAGGYQVTGHKTGVAVAMNYTSSHISKDNDKTYLNVDFLVPSMYFYDDQNVSGSIYDRSFQITWHDRTASTPVTDACYGNREDSGVENCPSVNTAYWSSNVDSSDPCLTVVSGALPWDQMMRANFHDESRIEIHTSNRTINEVEETPTWEVYMMAIIETWSGFEEKSDVVNDQYPNQLTINQERYSYYEIPFRISFPKQITITATEPIRIAAPMVVLYAVIKQETIDINFNPGTDDNFGLVDLTIKTQTQYPFGLRNYTDADGAGATITLISGDVSSVEWTSSQNVEEQCTNIVTGADGNMLCEQEWNIRITPNLCDVAGEYRMEAWAVCFTDVDGCALDTEAPSRLSNSWTGYMDFTIDAQPFCPQVIDEIFVQGEIDKYADNAMTVVAVPGDNVFSNDHVYFEVTYKTRSEKSGQTDFTFGDDSLIESVRPTAINMKVEMSDLPLQTEINRDNGDVTGSDLEYTVKLCDATPAEFPYNTVADSCWDRKGWNAVEYLDFQRNIISSGENTVDLNEIAFSIRLDERVIPVDIPNDQAQITVSVDSEVYYYGNDNPVITRRNLVLKRRRLESEITRVQHFRVSDSFTVPKKRFLDYCLTNPNSETVGFQMDMEMDRLELPNRHNANAKRIEMKYTLQQYFFADVDEIEIIAMQLCSSDTSCQDLLKLSSRRELAGEVQFVRYYFTVSKRSKAETIQNEFYNKGPILQTSLFKSSIIRSMKIDHCDEAVASEFENLLGGDEDLDVVPQQIDMGDSTSSFVITLVLGLVCLLY